MSRAGGDALLEHAERLVADQRVDARGDEARRLAHDDRLLAHAHRDLARALDRLGPGLEAPHDLDQLHPVHRVEEVHADDLVGALRRAGHLGHGQRRRVGRQDRRRRRQRIELAEELALERDVLGRGLDHEVAALDRLRQVLGCGEAGAVSGFRGEFPPGDALVHQRADLGRALVEGRRLGVVEAGVEAGNRCGVGDSAAHDAGAEDRDAFDGHESSNGVGSAAV
jgi:hypothetical protein